MEAASAALFSIFASSFPDANLPRFFSVMQGDEKMHQRLLRELKAYRKTKKP